MEDPSWVRGRDLSLAASLAMHAQRKRPVASDAVRRAGISLLERSALLSGDLSFVWGQATRDVWERRFGGYAVASGSGGYCDHVSSRARGLGRQESGDGSALTLDK